MPSIDAELGTPLVRPVATKSSCRTSVGVKGILVVAVILLGSSGAITRIPLNLAGKPTHNNTTAGNNTTASFLGSNTFYECLVSVGVAFCIWICYKIALKHYVRVLSQVLSSITEAVIGCSLTFDRVSLSFCTGFKVNIVGLTLSNPKKDGVEWATEFFLRMDSFSIHLSLCKLICSCGKQIIINDLAVCGLVVNYDKPDLLGGSNCDEVTSNLDSGEKAEEEKEKQESTGKDKGKFEIHKVDIGGVKAKATVKQHAEVTFVLDDIKYEDMMKTLGQLGDHAGAGVIVALILKILVTSIIKSVIENVMKAAFSGVGMIGGTAATLGEAGIATVAGVGSAIAVFASPARAKGEEYGCPQC